MVNFTFVAHKGARPEKSELVKAHVMRESQKKRREARQRRQQNAASLGEQSCSKDALQEGVMSTESVSLPYLHEPFASEGISAAGSLHLPSTDLEAFSIPWMPHGTLSGVSGTGCAANSLWSSWGGEHDVSASGGYFRCSNDSPSNDAALPPCRDPSALIEQPYFQHAAVQKKSEHRSSSWLSECLLNLNANTVINCTASLQAEWPGQSAVDPQHQLQRQLLVNSKVLLSNALFYCSYRDTVKDLAGNEHHEIKDRTLHLIGLALDDPNTAVSDDNIAAVISICMYENIGGSHLISTHLQGLCQLISMRGGVDNLESDPGQGRFIGEMALIQDVMHASCSNVPPTMFDLTGPILRSIRMNKVEHRYPHSPLRVINNASFSQPVLEIQASLGILNDAFNALEMLCVEAFDPDTAAEEAATFKLSRKKIWAQLQRRGRTCSNTMHSTSTSMVDEAIYLAAKIHFRAVAFRTQHEDMANAEDMKRLFVVIRKIDLGFWRAAHYVYLWILLTGGAASTKHTEYRPHFMNEILRISLSIGLFDWRSIKEIFGNFLWVQQFLRADKARQQTL